jgi:hypothetical protein
VWAPQEWIENYGEGKIMKITDECTNDCFKIGCEGTHWSNTEEVTRESRKLDKELQLLRPTASGSRKTKTERLRSPKYVASMVR